MGLSSGWRVAIRREGGMGSEKRRYNGTLGNGRGKKGVERRVVIFIKNVPRGSDASYEIVALTAAKLRLSRPKSRPQTGAY